MKAIALLFFITILFNATGQLAVHYDPAVQEKTSIQYFKPRGNLFVGDCIPFFHNNTYYLYWLLDSAHHSALNGLGGHQWTLSTSKDLLTWEHHPVVLGIDEDWEKSICTGSIVYHNNKFYAFYATRLLDAEGKVNEQLSYAVSDDGIQFKKQKPNPFYTSAPGYSKRDFRDPKVILDAKGAFHLFVSSSKSDGPQISHGALVHMISRDLKSWEITEPLISGEEHVPECPDYFFWKGWYYLIYGRAGDTYYLKSKSAYGPWEYPANQALLESWVNVAKTAAFTNDRRILAGWIPSKEDDRDDGHEIFGGNVVLRELTQDKDGNLETRFVPETLQSLRSPESLKFIGDPAIRKLNEQSYLVEGKNGLATAVFENVPANALITFEIEPQTGIEEYGLFLRSDDRNESFYKLSLSPTNHEVILHETAIKAVDHLEKKVVIQVVMKDDIIDVCINNKRCVVNRLGEKKGNRIAVYAKRGTVRSRVAERSR